MTDVGQVGQDAITCPRCGFEQPRAAECSRCGILFAKLRSEPVRPPHGDVRPVADQGRSHAGGIILLCLGVVVAAYVYASSHAPVPVQPASARQMSRQEAVRDGKSVRMPHVWYEGASGYASAMEEARQDHRVVAVYFYTDWCHYCRELEDKLLQTPAVQEHLTAVVKVKINPESGAEEEELARRYGIEGYPSFFIETPQLGRRQMINRSIDDRLKTPEEFVDSCREAAAG